VTRERAARSRCASETAASILGPIAAPRIAWHLLLDPNGIRLEFDCQPEDGDAPAVIPCITQTKAEARAELETLPDVMPEWIERRLAAPPG
jgi:hypothetical protein